jgi:uncharacterized membrane protein
MDKKEFLSSIAVVFFMAILFTQQGTNQWKVFAFFGLVFLGLWYFGK